MEIDKKNILKKAIRNSSMRWKKIGFAMLPHSLLFDERLPRASLMVYWVLFIHTFNGKNECHPSLITLETETRYSRPTIISAIESLKKNGWLKVDGDKKSGKVNKYYIQLK